MKINQKEASYPLRQIAFMAISLAIGFTLGSCKENEDTIISISTPSVGTSTTSSPSSEAPDNVLEKFCTDVQPTEFNQPLELNKIRIDDDLPEDPNRLVLPSESESKSSIIGCVTNHTDKPVNVSSMTFTFNETGWGATSIQIPVDKIQPGQTVAFWVSDIILTDMESIVIRSIDYSLGELQTEIEVRR